MKNVLTALMSLALLASWQAAFAQAAPPAINYQGRLTQSSGLVVPDGLMGLRVRLFATASGGSALWDSGDLSVATKSGTFSILLGSGSMPPMTPLVFSLGTVYLEVQPTGQNPLLPRQPIASVPWAFWASTSVTVIDGAITVPKLADNAVTSAKIASDSDSLSKVSGGAMAASSGTHIQLGLGPMYEQFMMVIKGNTIGNSNIPGIYIWNQGGQAVLGLQGNTSVNATAAAIAFYDSGPGSGEKGVQLALNRAGDLYTHTPTGDKVFLKYDGRVGVLTNDPQALLDVNGDLRVNGPASKPGGGSWSVLSDARLKKNIGTIEDPLVQLLKLQGRAYEYKQPSKIHEREGRTYGLNRSRA